LQSGVITPDTPRLTHLPINGTLEIEMKKLLIATTSAVMLLGAMAPTFAEQSEEGMKLREMRRAEFFMMKQMLDSSMAHMKSQEEMISHLSQMLQRMIEDCSDKNTRDGQKGC
jgi:hypothetical protein